MKSMVRIASLQMALHSFDNVDALFERVAHFARTASDYGADFLCLPEYMTLQALSNNSKALTVAEAINDLTELTDSYKDTLSFLAAQHRINIIGGSHMTRDDNDIIRNICFIAHRDGAIDEQYKIHPTPDERAIWGIEGGDVAQIINTDCGPVGVTICYDSEFPELGRHLVDQGANIIFVPYLTDTEHGHWRVTHSCMARAVENQSYIVTAGMVGTIHNVTNLDMAYAASRIITPCEISFTPDGIAAQASAGIEQMIIADIDLDKLTHARQSGAVQNLANRRRDLYEVRWKQ